MTVFSSWYDADRTILHIAYEEGWTWKDMHRHDRQFVIPTIESSPHPVGLIVDFSAAPLMPPREFTENIKLSIRNFQDLNVDVVVFTMPEVSIANLLQTSHRYYGASGRVYLTAHDPEEAASRISLARATQFQMA